MECMANLNAHDVDKVVKDAAPGFVEYQDGTTAPGNVDTTKKILSMLFASFPDWKGENQVYATDGNYVMVYSEWTATFKNDMGPIKATGKTIKYTDVDIFTLDNNGKITSHRNIFPNMDFMMRAGVDLSKMQGMAMEKKK
jgi:predicted ester cyclase